jgi:MoaA/NifB/PqqE/SkfB family radical SAM enzyme
MSGYSSNQLFGVTDADGTYNHNPNRMIETDKALEILRDAQAMGIRAVQFTGGGEPTVHPDFASIVLYAQGLGLETAIVSNGQKLNGHAAVAVRGSSWIRISIDAGTAESYQQIRRVRPGVFETVWKNVEAVVAARNGASPYVGLGFVVTKENWTEIPLFVGRARDAGVDNVRLAAVFTTEGAAYFEGFEEDAARLCRAAKALETDRFAVADMFRERAKDLHQGPPDYERCAYMHLTTYIGADLGVYRCCVLAYNTRGLIGSLKDQRLSDLWASEQKRKDFAGFDARGCDLCQFNERNREMNAMIDTIPTEHGNFV